MNRVESTPEQLAQTPTEASRGFLGDHSDSLTIALNVTNIGLDSFLAGLNVAQGNPEAALLWGVAAGCWATSAILKGVSMKNK